MINSIEDLRSAGVLPTGPVSAWPQERNQAGPDIQKTEEAAKRQQQRDTMIKATTGEMARGFLKTATQAVMNGKVSKKIREERYEVCKACPHFIEENKRCSECGCFMEAKTWVAGDPNMLCPKHKWKE